MKDKLFTLFYIRRVSEDISGREKDKVKERKRVSTHIEFIFTF